MSKHSNSVPQTSATKARIGGKKPLGERGKPFLPIGNRKAEAATPFYDSDLRELRLGTLVVKCFTQASDAQEVIVASFQEERWRRAIDDPLPIKDGQDPKKRLRRAVDNLNRRQRVRSLRFQVVHQGTGIAWRFLEDSDGRAT